jgi:Uma2 family endonuclease
MSWTAEFLFAFVKQPDDGSKLELVRGEFVAVPALNELQNSCRRKIWNALQQYARICGGHVFDQACVVTARNPDTVRFPALIYRRDAKEVVKGSQPVSAEKPPELVVEMILPTAPHSSVVNRVRHYLTAGVRLIWVADPESRICTVYRGPTKTASILCETDMLSGEDVLPGFSCRVADLFE